MFRFTLRAIIVNTKIFSQTVNQCHFGFLFFFVFFFLDDLRFSKAVPRSGTGPSQRAGNACSQGCPVGGRQGSALQYYLVLRAETTALPTCKHNYYCDTYPTLYFYFSYVFLSSSYLFF